MKILMTGSVGSFGEGVAFHLRAKGHDVVGVGKEEGERYRKDFLEVTDLQQYAHDIVFKERPDAVINHAGMTHIEWSTDHPVQKFDDVMKVNVTVPFAFCKAMMQLSQRDGAKRRVLNIGSMASKMGLRACPAYGASKAAVETMTRSLAKECGNRIPVSFFALGPGGIADSGMIEYAIQRLQEVRGMTEEEARAYNQQGGLERYCTWDEMIKMYEFMLFEAPEFATGSVWHMSNATGF